MASENTSLVPSREILEKSGLPVREISDMSLSILYNVIWPTARNAATNREDLDRVFEAFCQSLETLEARYGKEEDGPIDRKAFFRDAMLIKADSRYLLMGPPGHGKTTIFRETAGLFAEKLGVPFMVNPGADESIPKDAYVFYSLELAGDPTATAVKGLPGIEDGKTVRMKPDFIHALEQSKYGMLIFDDLANASPNVLAALHGLILERKTSYGVELHDAIAIGATGNLGALDGSHAQELSSAIKGRFNIFAVHDTAPSFLGLVKDKFGFATSKVLENYFNVYAPEGSIPFGGVPRRKGMGQLGLDTSPRRWFESVLVPLHDQIAQAHTLTPRSRGNLFRELGQRLPQEVGASFSAYIEHLASSVAPLVRDAYEQRGPVQKERYEVYFQGLNDGFKAATLKDEYSLVAAGLAVSDIVEGRANPGEAIARFCQAIARADLYVHEYAQAFRTLKAVMLDRLSDDYLTDPLPYSKERGLKPEFAEALNAAMIELRQWAEKHDDQELLQAFHEFRPVEKANSKGGKTYERLGVLEVFLHQQLNEAIQYDIPDGPNQKTQASSMPSM